jgi:hypothetical protein
LGCAANTKKDGQRHPGAEKAREASIPARSWTVSGFELS